MTERENILMDKLNSDLQIANAELESLNELIISATVGNLDVVKVILTKTKAKIECINNQIVDLQRKSWENQRSTYVDRRDGRYTC
jgi:hypothetical protein